MFLRDLITSLRGRWYLTLAGLVATALLCFGTSLVVAPTYEAKASLLLLPPADSVEGGGNYLLQLGGLEGVVAILNRTLNSQSANDAVKRVAPNATYTVAPDYTTSGPIIIITADDKTPRITLQTLQAVSDLAGPSLVNLQQSLGIKVGSRIRSTPLETDITPTTIRKTQIRALIIAAAGGSIGSALLIGLLDSWLLRRRSGRNAQSSESPGDDSSPTPAGGSPLRPSQRLRVALTAKRQLTSNSRAAPVVLQPEAGNRAYANGGVPDGSTRRDHPAGEADLNYQLNATQRPSGTASQIRTAGSNGTPGPASASRVTAAIPSWQQAGGDPKGKEPKEYTRQDRLGPRRLR